jgi:hypothetical protein
VKSSEGSYDPETVNLLRAVLDEAWAGLTQATGEHMEI